MFHVKHEGSTFDNDDASSSGDAGTDAVPEAARTIFGDRIDKAIAYHDALAHAGVERGLLGPREVPRLWDRHILNCAVIGDVIDDGVRVVDVGSGAGLPGIPLALARPDLDVTLIEPLQRRTDFLSEVIAELDIDVEVVRGRAEEKAVISRAGQADVVTSRAVAPLDRLARWSAPLLRDGGRLVAIKGASAPEEVEKHGGAAAGRGLRALEVATCGEGLIEPATTVVLGVRGPAKSEHVRRARRGGKGAE